MSKITLAAAAAVGYVFGARAGRDKYDQLAEKAESLWNNPKVQKGKRHAEEKAKEATSSQNGAGQEDQNLDSLGSDAAFGEGGDQQREGQFNV